MDGLAVGAHGYEADKAGFGEADGVPLDGGDVNVFGNEVEEGHCWGVDSGEEGTACGGMAICAVGVAVVAIDAVCYSVCLGHCCGCSLRNKMIV